MQIAFRLRCLISTALVILLSVVIADAAPLRVFIRAGAKTHGPADNGVHDHPRFLAVWSQILKGRGCDVAGGMEFPSRAELEACDVLIMFCADGGKVTPDQKVDLEAFVKRGGGVVVLHDAVCGNEAGWFKTIIGGAWQHGTAKFWHGEVPVYFTQADHPLTRGMSNFDVADEMYHALDFVAPSPALTILASTYVPAGRDGKPLPRPHIYETAPQVWAYDPGTHRAFVSLLGHNWATFEKPHVRALIMRGIAWAGRRANVDELVNAEELASLRYPEGGPTAPTKSGQKLEVHSDFTATLVASEPLINKPIALDWDASGRLWVAETPEYPNGKRGMRPDFKGKEWKDQGGPVDVAGVQTRKGLDRISILTDTNGDGVADKKQVFADDLELVTGFVFYKDGVIVTQPPHVLFLRDADGDGVADQRETLYTRLGDGDTHAVMNNPRWGHDGWIYATHGYSASRSVVSGDGGKDFGTIGSGVVRFKPDGSAMEQYSSKRGNTWGLTITGDGELFYTQPTSGELLMHVPMSEAMLLRGKEATTRSYKVVIPSPKSYPAMTWEHMAYVQIDWVGSFTAAAGAAIYEGGAWPASWSGSYFTTEPTVNLVHHEFTRQEGVSFVAAKERGREEKEFITARDLWFRPIEARVGPDGALYILDFYNQAAIHNDTRGPVHNVANAAVRPDRDHYFGRIWKVDHRDTIPLPPSRLAAGGADGLIAALKHPNVPVRQQALRLLVEQGIGSPELSALVGDKAVPGGSRLLGLWALHRQGRLPLPLLESAMADADPSVMRAALRIVADGAGRVAEAPGTLQPVVEERLIRALKSKDATVQLAALIAAGTTVPGDALVRAVVEFATDQSDRSDRSDPHLRSAVIGAANTDPARFLGLVPPARVAGMEAILAEVAKRLSRDPEAVARYLIQISALDNAALEALRIPVVEPLASTVGADKPAWSDALQTAFQKLLASPVGEAVCPLVARWDGAAVLKPDLDRLVAGIGARAADKNEPSPRRIAAFRSLAALPGGEVLLQRVASAVLAGETPTEIKLAAIEAVGRTDAPAAGALLVKAIPTLSPDLRTAAAAQLLRRGNWTAGLIAEIDNGGIGLDLLGVVLVDRLRNYPDRKLAERAQAVVARLRGPVQQQKDALVAAMLPKIETGGDAAKGKELFASACAVCHRFNGVGAQLGPELTGMGAHPRAELLVAVLDPNREVDPSFATWNITTHTGESHVGIVTRENPQTVSLRDTAGEREIAKADIRQRLDMGRSLMPEGFEGLGEQGLRDLFAYLQEADSRYRIMDLRRVVSADSRDGLFIAKANRGDSIHFAKFGTLFVDKVPFQILDPARFGNNLVVLNGGPNGSYARNTFPRSVTVDVPNIRANTLHLLSGVGGWAYPYGGDELLKKPVATVVVRYEGGAEERFDFLNGVDFADYNGSFDVPGSQKTTLSKGTQIRKISRPLRVGGVITAITITSAESLVAPVFAAITAELSVSGEPSKPLVTPLAPANPSASSALPIPGDNGLRILITGGGTSHDFERFFNSKDRATLGGLNPSYLQYTDSLSDIVPVVEKLDALVWTANKPIASDARAALMGYASSPGNGLVIVHAGAWYNWSTFPQWNRDIVGGGARSHDRYGEFEVTVKDTVHPIMAGVPPTFRIRDELYHSAPEPGGAEIIPLAEGRSPVTGKVFPVVWVVKGTGKARIACITLGHDQAAHDSAEYQTLLKNAVRWAAEAK